MQVCLQGCPERADAILPDLGHVIIKVTVL